MPKGKPEVHVINGKRFVSYEDIYNELKVGVLLQALPEAHSFMENDIIILVKNTNNSYDRWEYALIFSDGSAAPAVGHMRTEDLESVDKFKEITFEEYLSYAHN